MKEVSAAVVDGANEGIDLDSRETVLKNYLADEKGSMKISKCLDRVVYPE